VSEFGINNMSVANSIYWIARNELEREEHKSAIEKLVGLLKILDSIEATQEQIAYDTHKLLMYLYVKEKRYGSVSKHGLAILKFEQTSAKQNADVSEIEQEKPYLPIIRVAPQYPARAIESQVEGYVVVSFTVGTEGTTKNIQVIESSHKMFERSAMKAAEKYKYRPRIIDGNPAEVEDISVRIEFKIASSRK